MCSVEALHRPRSAAADEESSGALSLEVEEWQFDHGSGDAAAAPLDRPFHGDRCPQTLVLRSYGSEPDRLLQDRAPTKAGHLADLAAAGEHRDRRTVDRRADRGRQALRVVQALDVIPVKLESNKPAR